MKMKQFFFVDSEKKTIVWIFSTFLIRFRKKSSKHLIEKLILVSNICFRNVFARFSQEFGPSQAKAKQIFDHNISVEKFVLNNYGHILLKFIILIYFWYQFSVSWWNKCAKRHLILSQWLERIVSWIFIYASHLIRIVSWFLHGSLHWKMNISIA